MAIAEANATLYEKHIHKAPIVSEYGMLVELNKKGFCIHGVQIRGWLSSRSCSKCDAEWGRKMKYIDENYSRWTNTAGSTDFDGQSFPTNTSTLKEAVTLQQHSSIEAVVSPNSSTLQVQASRPPPPAPHSAPPPTAPHMMPPPTAPFEPPLASATEVHEAAVVQDRTEPPNEYKKLRTTILELKTVRGCLNFYDRNDSFQACIRLLRQAQDGYISKNTELKTVVEAREEWANLWAVALSHHYEWASEWAWALDHCRETALGLLYKVCDLCYDTENHSWSPELEKTFELRRIDEILGHCLVMDRAKALYNMEDPFTGEKGLGWYSQYNAEQYKDKFDAPLNSCGPTINKRLWWLFQVPSLHEEKVIQRWMQIAVPARLALNEVYKAAAIVQGGFEPPKKHQTLRIAIRKLHTVQECSNYFERNDFQGCIRLLRQEQNGYIRAIRKEECKTVVEAREEWAKLWAVALSHNYEWAWELNHCRNTALKLLYRVCDICFDDKEELSWSNDLEETFELRRICEILVHCLVMDRANALYNMEIRLTGEKGLGWYSKYNAEQYKETFGVPLNPRGHTINKRLWWLFQVPTLHEDEVIQRWMQIAVPVRLEK